MNYEPMRCAQCGDPCTMVHSLTGRDNASVCRVVCPRCWMALRPDKPSDIAAKAKRKRIAQTGADLLADELERERDEARAEVVRLTAECNLLLSEVVRLRAIVLETRSMTPDTPSACVEPEACEAPKRLTDDEAEALMSGKRYGSELWTFGEKPK